MTAQTAQQKREALKILKRRLFWIAVSFVILVSDQVSKWAITEKFLRPLIDGQTGASFLGWFAETPPPLPGVQVVMTSFFNIVMAWNTGVSFSLFAGGNSYTPYILIAVALAITVLFLVWLWKAETQIQGISYALVIGGALGNIIDRARFGAVIDFLDFHLFGYHWPAFNVADMAVVTGISLLIIVSLFFDIERKERYRKHRKEKRKFQNFIRKRFGR